MILMTRDTRRFEKLLFGLVASVARDQGMGNNPRYQTDDLTDEQYGKVVQCIWGQDGDLGLIDDFVSKNPLRFNRTDLREVESWKQGLYDVFVIVRDGRDTVFAYGDWSFAVRGVEEEAYVELGITPPAVCQALILPFSGVLTHGLVGRESTGRLSDEEQAQTSLTVAVQRKEGRIISSSRAYLSEVNKIVEEERALRAEYEEQFGGEPYDEVASPPEQHRGVLAGLSVDEREKAVQEHWDSLRVERDGLVERKVLRDTIDDECVDGEFAWTLAQAIAKLDDDTLLKLARRNELDDSTARELDHDALAREIARVSDKTATTFLYKPMLLGTWALDELRDMVAADGVLRFYDLSSELENVPHAQFPCILLYHRDHEFVCIMPREVLDALRSVDWKRYYERSRVLNDAYMYLDALQDMRGVVPLDDAMAECMDYFNAAGEDLFSAEDLVNLMAERLHNHQGTLEPVIVDDKSYLVESAILVEDVAEQHFEKIAKGDLDDDELHDFLIDGNTQAIIDRTDVSYLYEILRRQEGKPPCPPSKAILRDGVIEAMLATPEAQALVAYFDQNVPDGEDDYTFATDATRTIISLLRDVPNMEHVFDTLAHMGFVPTEQQLREMTTLLFELIKVVPKWANNGWSPVEVPTKRDGELREVQLLNFDIRVRE